MAPTGVISAGFHFVFTSHPLILSHSASFHSQSRRSIFLISFFNMPVNGWYIGHACIHIRHRNGQMRKKVILCPHSKGGGQRRHAGLMKTGKYEMDMCRGSIIRKVISFSIPLMLTGILQLFYNAADIIVVGQFSGKEALAAVGSTGALINLLINIFMGLSVGTSVTRSPRTTAPGIDYPSAERCIPPLRWRWSAASASVWWDLCLHGSFSFGWATRPT
jgi:hypothetical protein